MAVGRVVDMDGGWEFEAPGEVVALIEDCYETCIAGGFRDLRVLVHRGAGKGDYFLLSTDDLYRANFRFEYDQDSLSREYYEALWAPLKKECHRSWILSFDVTMGLWVPGTLYDAAFDSFVDDWSSQSQ